MSSAPKAQKDTYFWAPGCHITLAASQMSLPAIMDLMATRHWVIVTAVEEQSKNSSHVHVLAWGHEEQRWSAHDLSKTFGKWPNINPVGTQAEATNVIAYQCKQRLPHMWGKNNEFIEMFRRHVYDRTAWLHQHCKEELCEQYNSQLRRVRDAWFPEEK